MTNEEIIEGNKLIAEFMDLKGFEDSRYGWMWENPASDDVSEKETFSLKYHSSWDWLMPVVENIRNCKKMNSEYLHQCIINVSLINVYTDVIEFIKWYNQQK